MLRTVFKNLGQVQQKPSNIYSTVQVFGATHAVTQTRSLSEKVRKTMPNHILLIRHQQGFIVKDSRCKSVLLE